MMIDQRIELLRKMSAFGGLSVESLELLLRDSGEVIADVGDYFFCEGDPGNSVFVLESGSVIIERNWEDAQVQLGHLGPGDCFGEMALIDFRPRSASVRADSSCQAIEIHSRTLRKLQESNLEQYTLIMMNLGREVSRRLRLADECLLRLQQIPARAHY